MFIEKTQKDQNENVAFLSNNSEILKDKKEDVFFGDNTLYISFIKKHLFEAINEKQKALKEQNNESTKIVMAIRGDGEISGSSTITYGRKTFFLSTNAYACRYSKNIKEFFEDIPGLEVYDYTRGKTVEILLEIELEDAINYCCNIIQAEQKNNKKSYQKK